MPFKKGQTGNPNGRPKAIRSFKEALLLAVNRSDGDKVKLARIAEALVEKALTGDVQAINAVSDRLDGKPMQVIAGDSENPLTVVHEVGKTLDAKIDRIIGRATRKA